MQTTLGDDPGDFPNAVSSGEFIEPLSPDALSEFESLKAYFSCPANSVLFAEDQPPTNVLLLLAGKVKLLMNSTAGKRLILGIANPGETLGLASVLSGSHYNITAETLHPCTLASICRADFLEFLARHPAAYSNVARELCVDCARACEQVRALGLAQSAPARLARLLLAWSDDGQETTRGTRLFCSLTHGEIGECIGASRETVTRILSDFRFREVLESRGSAFIISNRSALEAYAGIA
ncbi:MAG TPA: Crp/Fnr family transcriptional regulator [Terracidiphilus sp.]|nr:Crp/Fnr family transcriptional regulator [Terracidiphilus sp.]